jgi:tetratricopeptide (TPR) repeat protein
MFHRAAALALVVAFFSMVSSAQRDGFSMAPRPSLPSAQDMFNSFSGFVTGMDNKPLKDVHVELRDNTGSTLNSTYTNSAGAFEFSSVRSGLYSVVATSGLEQIQEQIEIQRMSSTITLRLPVQSAANDGNPANSVSVAQYKVPTKARDELKKAQDALAKSKPDEAQKHLAKTLEIYPKYADAVAFRAILKIDAHDPQGALTDLQQAITYDQNCAMAYLIMGAVLNQQGKYDDAIRSLQRGEALSPNSWQAYFEMGKSLVGKNQNDQALRQLERAETLVPKEYPLIHLVKAHALLAMNNYSDAMTELQTYLQKEPQGPNRAQAQKMLDQARAFAARSAK